MWNVNISETMIEIGILSYFFSFCS